jgi:hypothetical protein
MILTNIKKLFEEAGIDQVRPTDEALVRMGISRRRFTLLHENSHKTAITVEELTAIKEWMDGIKEINSDQIVGDATSDREIAESLGLQK